MKKTKASESRPLTKWLDGTGSTVQASPIFRELFERNMRKAISDDIDKQIAGYGLPPKGILDLYPNGCPILSDGPQRDDL